MAPRPSYQLLIWSVPTVALLLTCLWYRRKRNSLRSDPGGTASVDLTALPSKRPDLGKDLTTAQSESRVEKSTRPVEALDERVSTFAADTELKEEVDSTEDLCRKIEADHSVTSIPNLFIPVNDRNLRERSSVQEPSLESHEILSCVESQQVLEEFMKCQETDQRVLNFEEEKREESKCEGKSEEDSEYKERESPEEIECKEDKCVAESECKENCQGESDSTDNCIKTSKYKDNCIKETEFKESCIKESECKENCEEEGECKEETPSYCEKERLAQTTSVNVHVLSGVLEDNSDKSLDILNFRLVEESDSSTKPSSDSVLISDSILPEQLAEEKYVSSSDKCVVINSVEPESVEKGSKSTALRPALCEGCSVSDRAVAKQHFEACAEETHVESAVDASESLNEASCVGNSVPSARTVMARKSSADLSMERSADSDGTAAHRDCKLSESEHRENGAESVLVERDSANHSPADVMLGSPAISNYSDANSEGSSDSGKGCSDMATPPPRTPASGSSLAGDVPSIYEFVLPQHMVGRLIGRYGVFIHQIHDKAKANVIIKKHPDTTKLKICAIEGNQMSIDRALEMIREKFPLKKYPNVTLEQVFFVPATPVFPVPQCVQLRLVEGVNNDVIVSYMVTPAHVFLQQPTHPTFLNLNAQAAYMQACYNEPTVPALPRPVAANVVCVAPVMGDWCRAQVVTDEAEDGTSTVRLLDYGGYAVVDCSVLRQIRQDFMLLPFQAAETYLANIIPAGGVEEEWSQEAFDVLEELTKGQVVEAQVVGYADNSVPIVYLYSIVRSKPILVNYELVKRGFAEWTEGCSVTNGNGITTDGDIVEECDRAVPAEQ